MSRLRRAIRIAGAAVLALTASWFSALVSGQSMTACDRAMAACTADLRADPDNPRLQYQLARAIVYHADRHGTSYEEGMVYLAQSADAGHVQAMFVYGLMLSREARACEAAPWTRRAAEGGLKAARLAYVDSAVGGQWADCDVTFNKDVMSDFLDAAADQVSGYYEKMLLGALRREVAALEPVAP
jgi:TPR repeat protein